ncbi:MAG TPA: hypothetical protein VIT88_01370 [Pyrinomonadaceae bacterium]
MTKRERYWRLNTLCVAVFGILLWFHSADASVGSPHSQATTKRERATATKLGVLIEEFSFLIKDFKIDHQGEHNNLNITIRYRYKAGVTKAEYPDFTLVLKDIEAMLTSYPNEGDYWEIVNKKITLMVLEKYPSITRVNSEIQFSPSRNTPYLRSSIATRER